MLLNPQPCALGPESWCRMGAHRGRAQDERRVWRAQRIQFCVSNGVVVVALGRNACRRTASPRWPRARATSCPSKWPSARCAAPAPAHRPPRRRPRRRRSPASAPSAAPMPAWPRRLPSRPSSTTTTRLTQPLLTTRRRRSASSRRCSSATAPSRSTRPSLSCGRRSWASTARTASSSMTSPTRVSPRMAQGTGLGSLEARALPAVCACCQLRRLARADVRGAVAEGAVAGRLVVATRACVDHMHVRRRRDPVAAVRPDGALCAVRRGQRHHQHQAVPHRQGVPPGPAADDARAVQVRRACAPRTGFLHHHTACLRARFRSVSPWGTWAAGVLCSLPSHETLVCTLRAAQTRSLREAGEACAVQRSARCCQPWCNCVSSAKSVIGLSVLGRATRLAAWIAPPVP